MKYALRSLAKSPGYTFVIVLTLALGIGANTAIFSFFHGILLRPLPFENPERTVIAKKSADNYGDPVGAEVGILAADFRELAPQVRTFSELATYTLDSATITGRGQATLASVAVVTPNFFSTLGAPATLGRAFASSDATQPANRLAVVSHSYWQTQLGGSASIIGQTVTVNRIPFTVVGVMPPDFAFPREAQLWVTPAADVPEHAVGQSLDFAGRGNYLRTVVGRLAPHATAREAEAELTSILGQLPNPNQVQRSVHLVNLRDHTIGDARPALAILLACVGLVLLIACLNVANLMLARATSREREIALRLALGAGRSHIARQLLAESLALALAGGAIGILLGVWTLDLLVQIAPDDLPRRVAIGIDAPVLVFALAITVLTGVLSGLAPILGTARSDLTASLRSGDRSGSTGA
ncbi:MAG TPA: ABC transporter permease, partial [Anaeromyxobacteraceae bacterium]|nr:ABC transporter permease [Anaeromyxobacteraceae bacterium]